jgi:hypothetical protein
MATSGRAWRDKNQEEVTLPSGNVALLRRPDMMQLATEDDAPNVLAGVVVAAMQGKDMKKLEVKPTGLKDLVALQNKVCIACFVSPKIVDNPQAEDEISLADLTMYDKSFVLTWAMGTDGAAAARFPGEPGGGVEPA